MFCRNCAEVILDTDVTCPKCGFAAGTGYKYCASCGTPTAPGSAVCEICGNPTGTVTPGFNGAQQFQAQPDPQFGQQFQSAPADTQFQQPQFQQTTQFQQPGVTPMRSDPNMSGYSAPNSYSAPNTYQQNSSGYYNGQAVTYKSKMTAGLLGIFLGCFGVHNFYLGYTGKAVAQLLMSLLSCGALAVVSEIWGFVEGIMILTGSINVDGKGLPLKD